MVKVYADLVEAGKYTTDPEDPRLVTGEVKLVPASIRPDVIAELTARGYQF